MTAYRITVSFAPADLDPDVVAALTARLDEGEVAASPGLVTAVETTVEAATALAAVDAGAEQILAAWRDLVDDREPTAVAAVAQSAQIPQLR